MTGKDEEVEMGERGRGRIKRDRGDYLLPLLNFNSLMTSGCFFNQMISSSSNSSSWFPYISPTPVRSQSRFTLKAEDMLLMSRFDGDILPLSIKLISCFEHPTDDANFSMLRFFSFLTCLILTFIFSLSTGKESVIVPSPVLSQDSFTGNEEHILLMVSSDTLQRPVSIREIKPQVLLILCAN